MVLAMKTMLIGFFLASLRTLAATGSSFRLVRVDLKKVVEFCLAHFCIACYTIFETLATCPLAISDTGLHRFTECSRIKKIIKLFDDVYSD